MVFKQGDWRGALQRVAVAGLVAVLLQPLSALAAKSQWVFLNSAHRLVYRPLPLGDTIADFSYAGYRGGGVALPQVAVRKTLSPSGGDDTAAIQTALDTLAQMPLVDGRRGALLLGKGTFHCSAPLRINASGVVLRGSGSGADGTALELTGKPHLGVLIAGDLQQNAVGKPVAMTDAYVPSGAQSIHVQNGAAFQPGDMVQIVKPVTDAWLHIMGMDELQRNGKHETWLTGDLRAERKVVRVQGNKLWLDVPLTDSYDAKYLGKNATTVVKISNSGEISEVGVEDLRIVAPAKKVHLYDRHFDGLTMRDAEDSWLRNLRIVDVIGGVSLGGGTRRITVDTVDVSQSMPIEGAAKPADFSLAGTQILLNQCSGKGDSTFYVATMAREQGPNVVLHCTFHGDGHIQPHQRWATGLLIDNCNVPEGGIDLMNRGEMGSGHGWALGWGVVWNSVAASYLIQMPPGAANWSIGNRGTQTVQVMKTYGPGPALTTPLPQGFVDAQGKPVEPQSLYLQQLSQRLGPQAVKAIGY